jgi:hypothetical protein
VISKEKTLQIVNQVDVPARNTIIIIWETYALELQVAPFFGGMCYTRTA